MTRLGCKSRSIRKIRSRFDEIYDSFIIGNGFFESDSYYRNERERYWRTIEYLSELDLPAPAKMLEIGGGQMSVLCKLLFSHECTVGDISRTYIAPLQKTGIDFVRLNLMDVERDPNASKYDLVMLLEVIEHVPVPAHVIFERIRPLLKPTGLLFLTTPNLFRLRNLIRMTLGIEFLDRFTVPNPEQSLGHQLEYSADHLRWQFERAKMEVALLVHDNMGRTAHSKMAMLASNLLAPLELRPIWRKGLIAAARFRPKVSE